MGVGEIVFLTLCGLPVCLLLLGGVWLAFDAWLNRFARHPWQAFRASRGWGRGVDELATRLEREVDLLRRFEPRYRSVAIPKKRGGYRRLRVPDAMTKKLQRAVLHRVLRGLRAHPVATGFERGLSIVENALPHARQAIVVSTDIVDFFPSTTAERVDAYFRRVGWNAEAAAILTKLTTDGGGLPQGAPTSPRLSNLVNYSLDVRLTRHAARRSAVYTRYADDITFSFPREWKGTGKRVRGLLQLTRRQLRVLGYELHHGKTTIRRRHQRQEVTGLVVNDGVRLPREVRRRLRAIRHRHATGRAATLTREQLAGWDAFESMIETRVKAADGEQPQP